MAGSELILASGSPRRLELLKRANVRCQVVIPDVIEYSAGDFLPKELVLRNARLKGEEVARDYPSHYVLACDTVVALGEKVFGKPEDLAEAELNLKALRGRGHEVMSGVAVFYGGEVREFVEVTEVHFKDFDDGVIVEYLGLVPVLDKAGGYAIQDRGEMLVERIEGDFDNVVGLPVAKVLALLQEMGLSLD